MTTDKLAELKQAAQQRIDGAIRHRAQDVEDVSVVDDVAHRSPPKGARAFLRFAVVSP